MLKRTSFHNNESSEFSSYNSSMDSYSNGFESQEIEPVPHLLNRNDGLSFHLTVNEASQPDLSLNSLTIEESVASSVSDVNLYFGLGAKIAKRNFHSPGPSRRPSKAIVDSVGGSIIEIDDNSGSDFEGSSSVESQDEGSSTEILN